LADRTFGWRVDLEGSVSLEIAAVERGHAALLLLEHGRGRGNCRVEGD
jgi:hypothetical protein